MVLVILAAFLVARGERMPPVETGEVILKTHSSPVSPRHTPSLSGGASSSVATHERIRERRNTERGSLATPRRPKLPEHKTDEIVDAPVIAVNAFAPGNRLPVNEQIVEVQSYHSVGNGNALTVVVVPRQPTPSDDATGDSESLPTAEEVSESRLPAQQRRGLSEEEELFRMRWGWAAFAAAQREASLHPGDAP